MFLSATSILENDSLGHIGNGTEVADSPRTTSIRICTILIRQLRANMPFQIYCPRATQLAKAVKFLCFTTAHQVYFSVFS